LQHPSGVRLGLCRCRTVWPLAPRVAVLIVSLGVFVFSTEINAQSTALHPQSSGLAVQTITAADLTSVLNLDGREIDLPGALPFGIAPGVRYETWKFDLHPGNRLTFYSDGVVEARSPSGEPFGFDRSRELSTRPAATIVEAARAFGQQDDITVVALACTGVADSALATASA
jgi:serine/threonine protein phosphatase PrpC